MTLEGPFLMAGLGAAAFGVDVAQLRDDRGHALIPAGQARGVLRQAALELARQYNPDALDVRQLFGARETDDPVDSDDENPMTSHRGDIAVTDLVARGTTPRHGRSTRVSIDTVTGAALPGMLVTVEMPAEIGEEVEFDGFIHYPARNETAARQIVDLLSRAVRLIPAIGAFKNVGFGVVVRASVTLEGVEMALDPVNVATAPVPVGDEAEIHFHLDRPLMISPDLPESNVLRSETIIPGSVLKGALARKLQLAGFDPAASGTAAALSRLRISHAVPYVGSDCLVTPTLHVALQRGKTPLGEPPDANDRASIAELADASPGVFAFFHDAKSQADCDGGSSGARCHFDVRTRTAIDPDRGAAADGDLFTHASLISKDLTWQCTACLPESDPDAVVVWQMLCAGLFDIGKSRAITDELLVRPAADPARLAPSDAYRVTLESRFHFCRTSDLCNEDDFVRKVRAYWHDVSKGSLKIAESDLGGERIPLIFASQSLAGGFAAAARAPFGDDIYEPLVLLEPGSVFILSVIGDKSEAARLLEGLVSTGLPCPDLQMPEPGNHRRTVHLPQNGFGAISVEEARL